jgi:dihydrofolate reductase
MNYNIIVATCKNNGIGYNNNMPWGYIKEDLKHFYNKTIGIRNNAVIMGRKTFESIGKPLKDRRNIILSKKYKYEYQNTVTFDDPLKIITYCNMCGFDQVWIIGGEKIYNIFLNMNIVDYIYQTKIYKEFTCDTYFQNIDYRYNIKEYKKLSSNPSCMLIIWEKLILKNNPTTYQIMDYL